MRFYHYFRDKKYQQISKRKLVVMYTGIVLALVLFGALVSFLHYRSVQAQVLSPAVTKDIDFNIFYWKKTDDWQINKASAKYDKPNTLLTYVINYSRVSVTVTEQSTPEAFSDVPQAYTKLLNTLNNYETFDSYYGKVALTRPREFAGEQSAVMNSRGTLLFAHPTNGSLTDDQWKRLFNALSVERS